MVVRLRFILLLMRVIRSDYQLRLYLIFEQRMFVLGHVCSAMMAFRGPHFVVGSRAQPSKCGDGCVLLRRISGVPRSDPSA